MDLKYYFPKEDNLSDNGETVHTSLLHGKTIWHFQRNKSQSSQCTGILRVDVVNYIFFKIWWENYVVKYRKIVFRVIKKHRKIESYIYLERYKFKNKITEITWE